MKSKYLIVITGIVCILIIGNFILGVVESEKVINLGMLDEDSGLDVFYATISEYIDFEEDIYLTDFELGVYVNGGIDYIKLDLVDTDLKNASSIVYRIRYRDQKVSIEQKTYELDNDFYYEQGVRYFNDVWSIVNSVDNNYFTGDFKSEYYSIKTWEYGGYATNPSRTYIMDSSNDIRMVFEGELPIDGYGVTLKCMWNPREITEIKEGNNVVRVLDRYKDEIQYYIVYTGDFN